MSAQAGGLSVEGSGWSVILDFNRILAGRGEKKQLKLDFSAELICPTLLTRRYFANEQKSGWFQTKPSDETMAAA